MADERKSLRCSFCGKHENQVHRMIQGPGVRICDECVNLCMSILDDGYESGPAAGYDAPDQLPTPREIKDVLDQYADVKGSLISILQKTQEIYGYVPIDAVYHIAERTGLTPAKIMGVATFYAQFRFQAVGKYLIMICKGTACYVNGANAVADAVMEELGIGDNETTADGLFSLSLVSCLGCCSLAPVMMINEDTYGSLTPDKVVKILRDIKAKEGM